MTSCTLLSSSRCYTARSHTQQHGCYSVFPQSPAIAEADFSWAQYGRSISLGLLYVLLRLSRAVKIRMKNRVANYITHRWNLTKQAGLYNTQRINYILNFTSPFKFRSVWSSSFNGQFSSPAYFIVKIIWLTSRCWIHILQCFKCVFWHVLHRCGMHAMTSALSQLLQPTRLINKQ